MIIIFWVTLSIIVGAMGSSRKIGFVWAFVAALFLSPLIGIFIVLASERKSDIAYKEKMLRYMRQQGDDPNIKLEEEFKELEQQKLQTVKAEQFKTNKDTASSFIDKYGVYLLYGVVLLVVLIYILTVN